MTGGRSSTSSSRNSDTRSNRLDNNEQHELLSALIDKIMGQMKRDQQQLIEVITSSFNQQLRDLHNENTVLKTKIALIEERMASTQLHLLNNNNNVDQRSVVDPVSNVPNTQQSASSSSWANMAKELAAKPISDSPALKAKKKMLKGTGDNNQAYKIKSAPQKQYPTKVFLTRVAAATEEVDVKEHIKEMFSLDVDVKKLETKHPSYASFMITTNTSGYRTLLDESKWPSDAAIRKWYEPRSKPPETIASADKTSNSQEVDLLSTNNS